MTSQNLGQQDLEAADHIASIMREQREMNVGTQLTLFSSGSSPLDGGTHCKDKSSESNLNNHSWVLLEACLEGDSTFSQLYNLKYIYAHTCTPTHTHEFSFSSNPSYMLLLLNNCTLWKCVFSKGLLIGFLKSWIARQEKIGRASWKKKKEECWEEELGMVGETSETRTHRMEQTYRIER